MNKRIIAFLLVLSTLLSFVACGEYNPPIDNGDDNSVITPPDNNGGNTDNTDDQPTDSEFTVTVMLNGEVFVPTVDPDAEDALKVRWGDGKSVYTTPLGKDGKASVKGLDGDYSVTLLNIPDGYTYDPNIYTATNDSPNVVIDLLTITPTKGNGNGLYNAIRLSKTGVYRATIKKAGAVVYYEFVPKAAGVYTVESLMDVSADMYNPMADVYIGSSAWKQFSYTLDDGGVASSYTKNFKHTIKIDASGIGQCYTFAIKVSGKDAVYPTYVDFAIIYQSDYVADRINAELQYPEFIPNYLTKSGTLDIVKYNAWYDDYVNYLYDDMDKFGYQYTEAWVSIDGKKVYDQNYYKLNPDDGYYHVYNEVIYAEYGGWGPILYANITIPTSVIAMSFNGIEYAGNKALTLSSGTENYKLFIEGYDELVLTHGDVGPFFCESDCPCYKTNRGACTEESNCTRCNDGCRHIPAKYKYQKGYADIAVNGRCPVTEELKEFLQKYSVSQKLFSDGNGFAEVYIDQFGVEHRMYDAYEDSQWLFACGYYC